MKKNTNDSTNAQRRAFLSKGIMLAGGIMLTPLWLEGCGGGDNQGEGRAPKKKKGPSTPAGDGGGGDSGTPTPVAGEYKCVDASELGSKQSVKITVNYKGEHIDWTDPRLKKPGLAADDGAHAMGQPKDEKETVEEVLAKFYPEPNPLGTKYVVEEKVLTIKEGDSVRLCNCVIVLDPRGPAKVAKNPRNNVHVLNQYFRFEPRVHDVATRGHVTWDNKDPVNHVVATPGIFPTNLPNVAISDGGTATTGKSVSTNTGEGALGFIKKGWYGVNCSLHAWELGRIYVSDHAYAGVSSKANKCEVAFDNVADGSYELQVWHESASEPIHKEMIEVKSGFAPKSIDLAKIA